MTSNPINVKQAQFVQEYIKDLNATQAAIRSGYSAKTAQQISSNLLSNVVVQEAVAIAVAERAKNTKIDQEWVIYELAKNVEGGRFEKSWADSNKALELLGRHLQMFPDAPGVNIDNRQQVIRFTIGKGYEEDHDQQQLSDG